MWRTTMMYRISGKALVQLDSGCHDTLHNDSQHDDTQHIDTQHNDTWYNSSKMSDSA